MKRSVYVFDPTKSDKQSEARGIGRYLQILKENFPEWNFTNKLQVTSYKLHYIFLNPFFNFLSPPLVMRRVAQKQIAVIHDLIPLKYPQHFPIGIKGKINVYLNKLSLKNYDHIITDSETSKKDIIKILRIEESKIKVVYPCLPKIFTNPKQISTSFNQFQPVSTNFCLYVGDAAWNKNLVHLVKAIKILNVTCVFVGKVFDPKTREFVNSLTNKWQSELKSFYHEIENDKRFILKGYVSDEELIYLYQQARVNILPSRDEGFGFSFLEAASQKCPSVLADIPVLREISDGNALFANPENPHVIANVIGELYWNNEKRDEIGLKAYKRSLLFSSSQFKKSFRKLIEKL